MQKKAKKIFQIAKINMQKKHKIIFQKKMQKKKMQKKRCKKKHVGCILNYVIVYCQYIIFRVYHCTKHNKISKPNNHYYTSNKDNESSEPGNSLVAYAN